MKTGSGTPPILLCIGPERWLQDQAVERLKSLCIKKEFEQMDLARFDLNEADSQTILEAVQTSPFGSPKRLVIVDGIEEIGADSISWLAGYLETPNPAACLVLCAEKIEEKFRPVVQKKPDVIQVLSCVPLKGGPLQDWVIQQTALVGKTMEPAAVHLLVTRCGETLQPLSLAVEALSLLVAENPSITAADVEALIAPSVRETVFDILDRAASGKPQRALEILHQALEQGRISVEQMMGALGWYYRMVWKAKSGYGGSSWGSPDRQAALSRLTRWPTHKIQKALDEVLRADESLKLGHPSPELLADQLLVKLAG